MDDLSQEHFRIVWAEIQGRFFSKEEAVQLIEEIRLRIITDQQTREMAAKAWEREP